MYDVLHFSPKDIDRAVLFATNNALVCETPEDANKVAYEMDKKTRYDVGIQTFEDNLASLRLIYDVRVLLSVCCS